MKFRRFLARHFPKFRLLPMGNIPGARQRVFMQMRDRPMTPYRGPFEDHVLLFVREGCVTFERGGQSFMVACSDALLIARGECGRLTFHFDPDTCGMAVEIMTFDERAVARTLRSDSGIESLVLSHARNSPTALHFRGLEHRLSRDLPLPITRFHATIFDVLNRYNAGLLSFFREHFYRHRWQLCLFLEGFVMSPKTLREAACRYPGGAAKLRRDGLLYIGTEPDTFLTRRRCEAAGGWLRCGHSIEKVAKALGFSSKWEFECAFAGIMKKRCGDVQMQPPLAQVEPEELIEALQPFWWEGRALAGARIPQSRLFPSSVMDEAMEDRIVAHEAELQKQREHDRQRRSEFTQHMREKAVDFFAMKSTGADLIIPIFNSSPKCITVAA